MGHGQRDSTWWPVVRKTRYSPWDSSHTSKSPYRQFPSKPGACLLSDVLAARGYYRLRVLRSRRSPPGPRETTLIPLPLLPHDQRWYITIPVYHMALPQGTGFELASIKPSDCRGAVPAKHNVTTYVTIATDTKTLGFALAKGLIRGLTRCPNPSSKS